MQRYFSNKYSFLGYIPLHVGKLSKGCIYCLAGRKATLFVTGLCNRNCFYCTVSKELKNKDIVLVNGEKVSKMKDIIKIVRKYSALGVGITGGEPLLKIDRVIKICKTLKNMFGDIFHIHLYTGKINIKESEMKLLSSYIDEIRFHIPLFDKKENFENIKIAKDYFKDVGIEIPIFPWKRWKNWFIENILDFCKENNFFINLNELEFTESNSQEMIKLKLYPSLKFPGAVKGVRKIVKAVFSYIIKNKINVRIHFCSVFSKDFVQMSRRYMMYWINNKEPYYGIDYDGTAIFIETSLDKLKSVDSLNDKEIKIKNNKVYLHPKYLEYVKSGKLKRLIPGKVIIEEIPVHNNAFF